MSSLTRLTNTGKRRFEEDSLYTFEVVKHDEKSRGAQAAIAAALKDDGTDMLENVLKSARTDGDDAYDFGNFRTILLRKAGIAVTAATLRVFGQNYAELPFIATKSDYRRDGNCRRLLKVIENLLREMKVKELIIPSVKKLVGMWKKNFAMRKLRKDRVKAIEDRIIVPDPDSSVMLVKSLLPGVTRRGFDLDRYEDGDSDGELNGQEDLSEDRLMKLATVTALESTSVFKQTTSPAKEKTEAGNESCSDMEEDFLDPPDVRPLWGNEIADMLRSWKLSDKGWKHWDLDSCSFQKLLLEPEDQPTHLQNGGQDHPSHSLSISTRDNSLVGAQQKVDSVVERQMHALALAYETRISALQEENQELRNSNVLLKAQLAQAQEKKEILLAQRSECILRGEETTGNVAVGQAALPSSTEFTQEVLQEEETGIDELARLLPDLTLGDSTEIDLVIGQVCRCLEALGSGVEDVAQFFAILQHKHPEEEFWTCLHAFLLSIVKGLSFTHDLAMKVQQGMKEAHTAAANQQLEGPSDSTVAPQLKKRAGELESGQKSETALDLLKEE
ncbi:Putative Acyl-CoA N-acyltransferases family protein [Klebsormidium nitens]|uniref:Putative Acyl-CoA N-acyltransferases family protein n=1 Tax=Klebsormidium nitens TaxID=105231 RepID=A0A1Y1HNX2_KLENI|nr:Putative Acyl-CoA N-acyltransferases family protein [Klebsormidium nitens]|eukprot:GAQ78681.1 Putative Acyl-CoA N-acyltransferases family protein [Klebsormidium nitens]